MLLFFFIGVPTYTIYYNGVIKIIVSQTVLLTNRKHIHDALRKPRRSLVDFWLTQSNYHSCKARRQQYARDRETTGNESYTRGIMLTPLFLYHDLYTRKYWEIRANVHKSRS